MLKALFRGAGLLEQVRLFYGRGRVGDEYLHHVEAVGIERRVRAARDVENADGSTVHGDRLYNQVLALEMHARWIYRPRVKLGIVDELAPTRACHRSQDAFVERNFEMVQLR